ncbi:MAG: helicase-related protein, partial [Chloroflexales bacterium]
TRNLTPETRNLTPETRNLTPDTWNLTPDTWNLIPSLNRWLIRQPLSVEQIVARVRAEVPDRADAPVDAVRAEVEAALVVGSALPDGTPGALRLRAHRLIRGGWQFYRCVNPDCGRLYPMGETSCATCHYPTAPLSLCRSCGAHYLRFVGDDPNDPTSGPLRPSAQSASGHEWMLYDPARFVDGVGEQDEEDAEEDPPRTARGTRTQPQQLKHRKIEHGSFDPHTLWFSRDAADFTLPVTLSPARTLCLCCGATLGSRNVITPVALGTSAAVKVMAEGMVTALADAHRGDDTHDGKERLLIFSDSRQDAAHQARFITFASRYDRMRRRLVEILDARGPVSLQVVVEALGQCALDAHDTPLMPRRTFITGEELERLRAYEEAPLLDDIALNAGYRATAINLGLVTVSYDRLDAYAARDGEALCTALGLHSPDELAYLCRCVLDEIRVRGCLSRPMLRYHPQHPSCPASVRTAEWERRVTQPGGYALGRDGRPTASLDRTDVPAGVRLNNPWRRPKAGGRGPSLERILEHILVGLGSTTQPTAPDMVALLNFVQDGSFVIAADLFGARDRVRLLQVNAETLQLRLVADAERLCCGVCALPMAGARIGQPCPRCHGRLVAWPAAEVDANRTVRRIRAAEVIPLVAAEHTAQVPNSDRATLESDFKAPSTVSPLNLLACSPTLEMGIDVGGLDAVILRNVPPRPDNYAQRGGRAGRRTRVGLVLGYARNTPHDQYFYDKPTEMIAGEVPAPALALGNRDVILRHMSAIAFGAAEPGLAGKMLAYINPQGVIDQVAVDALIAGVRAQFDHTVEVAEAAWGADILPAAGLRADDLRASLERLPERTQDVFQRMARQVVELRQSIERFTIDLQRGRDVIRAADLINRLLGVRSGEGDADDRSSGYPLRRFAEFGLLPGYEFPSEPASLRLHGDRHEDDPISVARRFGIAQFQPGATVYARGARWKVIGLDTASPWNPRGDGPSWVYRQCRRCTLRYHADEPGCPRCHAAEPGLTLPAAEYAGFLAVRNESPILDEEDRYAVSNRVVGYPQWGAGVVGRWSAGPGWGLRLSAEEEVRWVNEGPPPGPAERAGRAYLTEDAAGYRLCPSCGRILQPPAPTETTKGGRRQTRPAAHERDAFGHGPGCPEAGRPPKPVALVTATRAEVLRVLAPVPDDMDEGDLMCWGLSLGYALRLGMRHRYMLDGPEIEFLVEGPWPVVQAGRTFRQMALSFIDPSVGGSGYLRRIAEELHLVALRAIEHLDHPTCTRACYRCLKSYENQRYHDQLSWPRIIADLYALADAAPVVRPREHGDIDDPGPWLEAYAAGVGSPLELRFLRLFETYGFHPQTQVPVSPDGGSAISVADFAVPERRMAIYVDGAAFHSGANRARDAHLRDQLRRG